MALQIDQNKLKGSNYNYFLSFFTALIMLFIIVLMVNPLKNEPEVIIKILLFSPLLLISLFISLFLIYRQSSKIELSSDSIFLSNIRYKVNIPINAISRCQFLFSSKANFTIVNYNVLNFFVKNNGSLKISIYEHDQSKYFLNFTNLDPTKLQAFALLMNKYSGIQYNKNILNSKRYSKYSLNWEFN